MRVRAALPADAPAMSALQNQIIRIGGTTAHQTEQDAGFVALHYVTGPEVICCHLAEDGTGLIGFQSLGHHPALPEGWGDIGSYVSPDRQRTGAGAALFEATLVAARQAGIVTINAAIRADNQLGLGYYTQRGFVDHGAEPGFALADGRVVGRVFKRFDLILSPPSLKFA